MAFNAVSCCSLFALLVHVQGSYVLAPAGDRTCPQSYSPVLAISDCKAAAASLQKPWAGAGTGGPLDRCYYTACGTCDHDIRWYDLSGVQKVIPDIFNRVQLVCTTATPPAPPPSPPPTPKPTSSWPTFATLKALRADPWSAYYKAVYGELPSNGYPLKVGSNWVIYDQVVISAKVKRIPASVGDCPTANPPEGQRYAINNRYSPRFSNWIWHPYPYQPVAPSTWVEVIHEADPFGDEHYGAWFIFAPGSGIYFNTGSTLAFKEHGDAYTKFNIKAGGGMNEDLCKAAAGQGYDSLQFLAHVDPVNYQCDTHNTGNAGLKYMGVELVGVKLAGSFACTSQKGAPPVIKIGWGGSKTCVCDNSKAFLNCKGVPELSQTMSSDDAIYNVSFV